jgi:DNA-binding transcriptional LysR family regulator
MVELRQLRYFVAVAEELHFGRAAERVGIAQPPLSQQIQGLERELGVQLFERTKRRVQLTPAGAVMLEEARHTLQQAARTVELAQRAGRGEAGHLGIGFVGSATYRVLPDVLRAFRERYPGVRLTLLELSSARQVVALHERGIDVGFVRPPLPDRDLIIETVERDPLMAVLPVTHVLAARPALPLAALADESFVLFPPALGPGLHAHILGACERAGFTPRVTQEAIEQPTIVSLVSAGIGVSLLPASIERIPWPGVACRPLTDDLPPVELALARRHDDQAPVLAAFLAVARAAGDAGARR